MPLKANWAYDFACDVPIEEMEDVFNKAGPWRWQLRDSSWYGDYLNTRPLEGVRVRVHEYPQPTEVGVFTGLRDKGFSALLEIDVESSPTRTDIDGVFRQLLSLANAANITSIEPYD